MRRFLMAAAGLLLAAAAAPPSASAGDFLPTITDVGGSLEIGGLHERFMWRAAETEHTTDDTFLTERVTLMAEGWIYHPRLLIFSGMIGGGLAHEDVQSNYGTGDSGGMRTEVLEEYSLRTVLLPEHPYNLELYTQRSNPYKRGTTFIGSTSTGTASGAVLRLKLRPYVASLGWRTSKLWSKNATRGIDTLTSNVVYYRDWGSLAGSYTRDVSDTSFDGTLTRATADAYTVDNQLRSAGSKVALSSTLGWNNSNQNSAGDSMADRRFSWNERLSLSLPARFDVNISASRYEDSSTRQRRDAGAEPARTSRSDSLGLMVMQKLYQSLTTTYSFVLSSLDSSTGGSEGSTHSLSSAYLKRIPGGLLSAGLTASLAAFDRNGSPAVINETHAARLFDEFSLAQTDADASSIILTVRSATTGSSVELTPGIHYQVGTTGALVSVRLLALPASAVSVDPFFSYTFSVSYSLHTVPQTVNTTAYGGSLRLELFNHQVIPYFAYSYSREDGSSAWPRDTAGTTVGLALQRLPHLLTLEYQEVRSDINPFGRFKANLVLRQDIGSNSLALGQAQYTTTDFGDRPYTQAYTEDFVSVAVRLQQRFPRQHLTLQVGGIYDSSTGRFRREAYSLEGELTWILRQLEVTASVSFAKSRLELPAQRQESEHQLYYLKVTRKLF